MYFHYNFTEIFTSNIISVYILFQLQNQNFQIKYKQKSNTNNIVLLYCIIVSMYYFSGPLTVDSLKAGRAVSP